MLLLSVNQNNMSRQEGRHTPLFDSEDAFTMAELVFIQLLAMAADYDSTEVVLGNNIRITVGDTAPTSPSLNDLWIDTSAT